jgi:hypothetical protein
MRARAHPPMLCVALLAAACGSGMKAAPQDAAPTTDTSRDLASPDTAPAADLADHRDVGMPDATAESVAEIPPPDTARDALPTRADLPLEARSSDLPVPDLGDADGAADAGHDLPGNEAGLDATADATVDATSPLDGELAAFCTGPSPRMVVNGKGYTPTIDGQRIVMDCCDGGEFVITNPELTFPIGVTWLLEAGPTYGLPATIDLVDPQPGWRLTVAAGCNVTSAGCVGAMDDYQSGLIGWLTVALDPSGKFDMSVCVHVEEQPGETQYNLHSLDFYATHVLTW